MRQINKKEWDNIINQAFSPDAPEPKFSTAYKQKKKEIIRQAAYTAQERRIIMKKSTIGFMTACTASITIAGLAVYSGLHIWQAGRITSEQNQPLDAGNIAEMAETEIQTEEIAEETSASDIFEVIFQCEENEYTKNGGYYQIAHSWTPDDLEYREDGPYGMKFHDYQNENSERAITPDFCRVADVTKPYIQQVEFVESAEEFVTQSGNPALLITRKQGYDMLFVQFSGTPYVASYFVNELTDEEVHMLADNMFLIESDKETAGIYEYPAAAEQENNYQTRIISLLCGENEYTQTGGYYDIQFGWAPEDLEYHPEDTTWGYEWFSLDEQYTSHTRSIMWDLACVEDVTQPFETEEISAAEFSEFGTESNNLGIYVVSPENESVDSMLYMQFTGTPYVARLFMKGISEEEAYQIAENLCLKETEEKNFWLYSPEDTSSEAEIAELTGYINSDMLNLVHVSDTVSLDDAGTLQMTIRNASLQKNFDGITTDCIGLDADYSQYLDQNGEIWANRKIYTSGNDEAIAEDSVQQYILKLDLTLSRTADNDYSDFENGHCFFAPSFSINKDNSITDQNYRWSENLQIDYAPDIDSESFFSFSTEHEHQKNGIYDLKVGESADVTLCYTVDADKLTNLYVALLSSGTAIETYVNAGLPVLDLCDLTAPE